MEIVHEPFSKETRTDDLESKLRSVLLSSFGLKDFRKGQLEILKSVLNRKDTLAVMPTGGGKSLCYQLPSIFLNGLVVVVSPLISLMSDQVRLLQSLGLSAGFLNSSQTPDEKRVVFNQMKTSGPFVLFLSPERVQNPGFADWIKSQNVVLFAIDEAHCVSQWGPDFREDYHKLKILRELRPDVPILALTATATPQVLADVGQQLRMNKPDKHVYGFYRPNLFYQVEHCVNDEQKFEFLKNAIRQIPIGKILIYCGTRKQARDVAAGLKKEFLGVAYYHAGLSAETRQSVQEKLQLGKIRILTATNAFGMGIDYPDVRLVVHYQMPANIESFYQEMGRAGRDGEPSQCLLLYSKKDKGLQAYFIQQSDADKAVIDRRWDCLNAITQFAEGGECRHAGILTYFKDTERITRCSHCDVCEPHSRWMVRPPAESVEPIVTTLGVPKPSKRKKDKSKQLSGEISGPEAEARKIILKDWRRDYAKENDIPAFIVFSDKTLVDLANKNPKNKSELQSVYGFGPAKVEALGDKILSLFR